MNFFILFLFLSFQTLNHDCKNIHNVARVPITGLVPFATLLVSTKNTSFTYYYYYYFIIFHFKHTQNKKKKKLKIG